MKTQITIFIDSYENTQLFNGKLSTSRDGFARVKRNTEPKENEYGMFESSVKISGNQVTVEATKIDGEYTIQ